MINENNSTITIEWSTNFNYWIVILINSIITMNALKKVQIYFQIIYSLFCFHFDHLVDGWVRKEKNNVKRLCFLVTCFAST